jgi:molybdenum cofactor cytidylyltransferase
MRLVEAFRLQHRDVVALVGGGGKTTTMMQLAQELAQQGRRVVTMTTTSVAREEAERAVLYPLPAEGGQLGELEGLLQQHRHVMVLGASGGIGVTLEEAARVSALPFVDNVIVEADGARMLPFKAPAGHEPLAPPTTTLLVPVVGLDILGQSLTAAHVHRPELVARLAEVPLAASVDLDVVAAVLTHPEGGLKGVPEGARVVPLINKIGDAQAARQEAALPLARDLAQRLLACDRVSHVVLGAHGVLNGADNTPSPASKEPVLEVRSRVAAVILAAGAASRYGALKQLLPWGEGTLLSHVVDTALASCAQSVVVVLGNQARACRQALGDRQELVEIVVNDRWAQGQSTSVQAGLSVLAPNISAALFPLADAPLLTTATMDAIIARYWRTFAPVVWPEYEGKRGNPVLFDRALFSQLNDLSEDTGGRSVLRSFVGQVERVSVADAGILKDIDTPQDYDAYRQATSGSSRP